MSAVSAFTPVTPAKPGQSSAAPLVQERSKENQSLNPVVLLLSKVQTAYDNVSVESPGDTGMPQLVRQAERVRDGAYLAILQLSTLWLFAPSISGLLWVTLCSYVIYQVAVVARNVLKLMANEKEAKGASQGQLLEGFFSEVILLAMTIGHAVVSAWTKKEPNAVERQAAANPPEREDKKLPGNVSALNSAQSQVAPSEGQSPNAAPK